MKIYKYLFDLSVYVTEIVFKILMLLIIVLEECNKDQAKKDKQKKTKNQEFQIKFQRISALKNHNKI